PFELDEIRRAVNKAAQKLQKEAAEKDSGQQIDRLSDLTHLLATVADRPTICTVSTRFVMIHCQSTLGEVIFWDRSRTAFTRITIVGEETAEETLPPDKLTEVLHKLDTSRVQEPGFISSLDTHPLLEAQPTAGLKQKLRPRWLRDDLQLLVIPVGRGDILLGVITVGLPNDTSIVKGTDLKLLGLIAGQLALSLENLELLEEAQASYTRLKALQDETIELEKMATRGEMSAEIGHELNNFLGVVTGNMSLLDHHLRDGNYTELPTHIQAINDTIEKIKIFTGNLMDLTPISSQKKILRFDQLLAEVVNHLKPQRRFQDVSIRLSPPSGPISFEADSVHIQQLLYNLFNNAADATTGCDRREITVQCDVNPNGDTFSFHITDTGAGMDNEQLTKLFQEQFTTKDSGHGIGLVVCRSIVENHGGKISVDSTPGVGTSIRIDFPLAQSDTTSTQPVTV
ncbi:MAG: HAMP domain-containing sensor histidine kinase, partial [Candidatus Zixiibacteriota bacterium]